MHNDYLLICGMILTSSYPISAPFCTKKAKNKKSPGGTRACGDEWARTTDSRIFSPMLYQLSYITFVK